MGISSFESFNDWRCDFSSKPSEIVSSGQITNSSAIIMKGVFKLFIPCIFLEQIVREEETERVAGRRRG